MIWLATEDVYLFVEGNGRVLQSACRGSALSGYRATPFQAIQIQNEKVVEPRLAITATKDIHLVVNDAGRVELPHRSGAPDDAWNVKAQFVDSFFQIDENNV